MAERPAAAHVALWVVSALMAALYLFAGGSKLAGAEQAIVSFRNFGYVDAFRLFIGACEVAGAVGLLIPRLASLAAGGLMLIMVGAAYSHMSVGETPLPPLVPFLFLIVVFWFRRADLPRRAGGQQAA